MVGESSRVGCGMGKLRSAGVLDLYAIVLILMEM